MKILRKKKESSVNEILYKITAYDFTIFGRRRTEITRIEGEFDFDIINMGVFAFNWDNAKR